MVLTDTADITEGAHFYSLDHKILQFSLSACEDLLVCAECDPPSGKREWVLTDVADRTQLGTSQRVMAKREKIREYSQSTCTSFV